MRVVFLIVACVVFVGCEYRNPRAEVEQVRQQSKTERARIHQETIENVVPWTKHRREVKSSDK